MITKNLFARRRRDAEKKWGSVSGAAISLSPAFDQSASRIVLAQPLRVSASPREPFHSRLPAGAR